MTSHAKRHHGMPAAMRREERKVIAQGIAVLLGFFGVIALFVWAIVATGGLHLHPQSQPGTCDYDYNHTYMDRGTPYDIGKDAYCRNWKDGQTLDRVAHG